MKTTVSSKARSSCPLSSANKTGSKPAKSSRSNVSIVANTGSNGVRPRQMKARSIGIDRRVVRYLVDANVLGEPTKKLPNAKVVEWLRDNEREIAVDPIILGELRFGILLLRNGRRRTSLERWFDAGVQRLRCLPWEAETGLRWAQLLASLRTAERAMPIKDSLIAATALVHGLTVVTRNGVGFEKAGLSIIDPFG
jgi:toxin FitB